MAKRKRNTVQGFQPTANPALAAGMRELAKSNAAGTHQPKHRKQSRGQKQRNAIRDQFDG